MQHTLLTSYDARYLGKIGVISGFGPQASASFLHCIFNEFSRLGASKTPDFPEVLLLNVQTVPVFGGSDSGFVSKKMTIQNVGQAIERLERMGADFIVIPCNSMFGVVDELSSYSATEILHIADPVVQALTKNKKKRTLLLGTGTTLERSNDVYYSRMEKASIECFCPDATEQEMIDRLVVKVFQNRHSKEETDFFAHLVEKYEKSFHIDSIIIGCTEISILIKQEHVKPKLFDSLELYAEATAYRSLTAKGALQYDTAKIYEESGLQDKFVSSKKPESLESFFRSEESYIQNLKNKGDVLDAGCGSGRHLALITSEIQSGIGIDYNSAAIEQAKNTHKDPKLRFFVGNIFDIPFPEHSFDTVLCLNHTLGNLPKHRYAIKELLRVLRLGGKVVLTVHSDQLKNDKLAWYEECGLKEPSFSTTSYAVTTQEGFYSYCFPKNYLDTLFAQFKNISFNINHLTPYSYVCTLTKNK